MNTTPILRVTWLVALWFALWEDVSIPNLVSGVVFATLIVLAFDRRRSTPLVIRPVAAAKFAGIFLVRLVQSNLTVARTVLAPRGRLRSGIVAVPLESAGDGVATVVADAITLTPGTLSLDVGGSPTTVYVHALHVDDLDEIHAGVREMELLAVRAFGSAEAVAGLAVDDTTVYPGRPAPDDEADRSES